MYSFFPCLTVSGYVCVCVCVCVCLCVCVCVCVRGKLLTRVSSAGEKPFECRLCGQRSRDYSAMIKHLRTHGGAGPYQCTACSDYCSSLAAMQKHVERHAPQDFPPDWTIRRTYLYTSHV